MSDGAQGTIVSIYLCTGHRDPMEGVESADMKAGYGIEGDRHAVSEGVRTARQVLLMDEGDVEQVRPRERRGAREHHHVRYRPALDRAGTTGVPRRQRSSV